MSGFKIKNRVFRWFAGLAVLTLVGLAECTIIFGGLALAVTVVRWLSNLYGAVEVTAVLHAIGEGLAIVAGIFMSGVIGYLLFWQARSTGDYLFMGKESKEEQ